MNKPRHRQWAYGALVLFLLTALAGFVALGIWQIQRLAWKEQLIARIDARVAAAPVALETLADASVWSSLDAADNEYTPVVVQGRYRVQALALVSAATTHGQGYWLMAPLQQADGSWVYINQGFIPQGLKAQAEQGVFTPQTEVSVNGLLRASHAKGGVLRDNLPAEQRWYPRDVLAMAATHGLSPVAPFFIDAAASAPPPTLGEPINAPVAGLTVIQFRNNHLSYALTWFAMALGCVLALWLVWRERATRNR